jgi:ABC-2 type transport system ATP-binding protein
MDEAQSLADRVAVLSRGQIVAEGSPATLAGRAKGAALVRFTVPRDVDLASAPLLHDLELETEDGLVSFHTDAPTRVLAALCSWASERGVELDALTVTRPTLEDIYLELTEGAPS